jgi:hypothetical protein
MVNHRHFVKCLTEAFLRWMEAVIKNDRDIRYKLLWNIMLKQRVESWLKVRRNADEWLKVR